MAAHLLRLAVWVLVAPYLGIGVMCSVFGMIACAVDGCRLRDLVLYRFATVIVLWPRTLAQVAAAGRRRRFP